MNLPYQRGTKFNADFDAQYRWYFEHAGEEVAGRFLQAVEASLNLLATQPELGVTRRFSHPKLAGLRSFRVQPPFNRMLIFYQIAHNEVNAWRLMDGTRDLSRRLIEPSKTGS